MGDQTANGKAAQTAGVFQSSAQLQVPGLLPSAPMSRRLGHYLSMSSPRAGSVTEGIPPIEGYCGCLRLTDSRYATVCLADATHVPYEEGAQDEVKDGHGKDETVTWTGGHAGVGHEGEQCTGKHCRQ